MQTESEIEVRYAETDQMGIVHHSVYPIWYEVARTDFTNYIGMAYAQMEKEGVMTPLVELTSHYLKPAYYGEKIMVTTRVEKITPARIVFAYEVYCKKELINTGTTMHAWTNNNLKPMNLKKQKPSLYNLIQKTKEKPEEIV